ncbi:MAG TPA: hypothetical protein VKY86_19165 [Promicromonospora sp.]|nr:hypothetical protein [Promicromonospora sp.]
MSAVGTAAATPRSRVSADSQEAWTCSAAWTARDLLGAGPGAADVEADQPFRAVGDGLGGVVPEAGDGQRIVLHDQRVACGLPGGPAQHALVVAPCPEPVGVDEQLGVEGGAEPAGGDEAGPGARPPRSQGGEPRRP